MDRSQKLTVIEAANELRVSRTTVYRYCEQGLPYHTRGQNRGRHFDPADILAWWERHSSTPAPSGERIVLADEHGLD